MIKATLRRIVVLPFLLVAAGAAHAAALKSDVMVSAPVVTLGDVLTDAGQAASIEIAAAPAPGQRMVLSAGVIARVAAEHGVDWENPYSLSGVAVTRAGKPVSREAMVKSIGDAISAQGDKSQKSIQLSATQGTLYVPVDAADVVDVANLTYDHATGMFTATVTVPADGGRVASATVTGRAIDVINIPVLNRAVSRGDLIAKSDIDWVDVSPSEAQGPVITDEKDLIGKMARRPLRADLPLRTGDVQEPILVGKNALVTIVAATPNLTLTTIGRSIDEGSAGDVIRVMNMQSHKIVQGTVMSSNEVRVEISSRIASLAPQANLGRAQH
jgi:flagella basal body P-ring formation protein FlgA